jgi:hypothetical protein
MSAFKQFAERTAAALRKLAAKEPKAQDALAPVAAAPADKARPFMIVIRQPDGNLKSVPATAAELDAYLNNDRTWRRIAE